MRRVDHCDLFVLILSVVIAMVLDILPGYSTLIPISVFVIL